MNIRLDYDDEISPDTARYSRCQSGTSVSAERIMHRRVHTYTQLGYAPTAGASASMSDRLPHLRRRDRGDRNVDCLDNAGENAALSTRLLSRRFLVRYRAYTRAHETRLPRHLVAYTVKPYAVNNVRRRRGQLTMMKLNTLNLGARGIVRKCCHYFFATQSTYRGILSRKMCETFEELEKAETASSASPGFVPISGAILINRVQDRRIIAVLDERPSGIAITVGDNRSL